MRSPPCSRSVPIRPVEVHCRDSEPSSPDSGDPPAVCRRSSGRSVALSVALVRQAWTVKLSYRDVEELLLKRGVEADHVTVFRWVQRFTHGGAADDLHGIAGCSG